MNSVSDNDYKWIWPFVGATPISQDLNSEMFDRTDHPCAETFVREAIQNSLDARLDSNEPVRMNFTFHDRDLQTCRRFIDPVMKFRQEAGLDVPPDWTDNKIKYLLVEDFNTTGLTGDLTSRTSDFWNYWLNFGLSNKGRANLGGRGIGRVTFLIASHIHAVIGYTRRKYDGKSAICGMALLRAQEDGKRFRSTHAYFADKENDAIYQLHDANKLENMMQKAFCFMGYSNEFSSGLALIIPYPNNSLTPDSVMAAAIENFAPAIINGTLVINSNTFHLDHNSIEEIGTRVKDDFISAAIKQDPVRYFKLVQQGLKGATSHVITIRNPSSRRKEFEALRHSEEIQKIQKSLTAEYTDDPAIEILELKFPLKRNKTKFDVGLRAVIAAAPSRVFPFDRLFREGMSLPDVYSKNPGALDLIVLTEDETLVEYLNLCEGKAHLDLLESEDVKQKLRQHGFDGLGVRRLVKFLPGELRQLLTPNITEPDANVLLDFFSIPISKRDPPPRPPPTPPDFVISKLDGGLRINANPRAEHKPANLRIVLAYADGTRRSDRGWDPLDFDLADFNIEHTGIERFKVDGNQLAAYNCATDFVISITGFDQNRELDALVDALVQDN